GEVGELRGGEQPVLEQQLEDHPVTGRQPGEHLEEGLRAVGAAPPDHGFTGKSGTTVATAGGDEAARSSGARSRSSGVSWIRRRRGWPPLTLRGTARSWAATAALSDPPAAKLRGSGVEGDVGAASGLAKRARDAARTI